MVMYAEHTAADFREHLELPADYTVAGVLVYGTWDLHTERDQLPLLRQALDQLETPYQLRRFTQLSLGHCYELTLHGRHYWYVAVMGTAMTAQYLHMAALLGSRRNVLLGIVGGLQPGMRTADMILPDLALGNDNAAFYSTDRASREHVPDPQLRDTLRAGLPTGLHVWEGPTTTCEMMLGETRTDVDAWHRHGFLGVEMEGALVFALSRHFDIPAAALFYVADNLIEQETMLTAAYARQHASRLRARELQYSAGIHALLGPDTQAVIG